MADIDLVSELMDSENETLQILLASKAMQGTIQLQEFIDATLAQGVSRQELRRILIDDLENKGFIFGAFNRAIKATANGTINRIRDVGQYGEHGIDKQYRWGAVFVNTCPDCTERHNMKPRTWEQWEQIGLPRTGTTICKQNCRCMLIPAEFATLKPVKVEPRK